MAAQTVVEERPEKWWCTRCGKMFTKQKGSFPASQSSLYKSNGGYLPVCRHCLEDLFQHYKAALGDEKKAIYRLCMKFDIYWSDQCYDMLSRSSSATRMSAYIGKTNIVQFAGKTFDDTLDEEEADRIKRQLAGPILIQSESVDITDGDLAHQGEKATAFVITPEIIDFWGGGFDPAFYRELESRRAHWCKGNEDSMDIGELAVIKQICIMEVTINRDAAAGKSIAQSSGALNNLLGSANLKPVQKKDEALEEDNQPFGVWIRKIENTEPIPEAEPEFKDVDGIAKYIMVWFFGHLCKMLKIHNKYSRLYEEEIARLKVERPEYEGEDEETILEDIFERASANEEDREVDGDGDVE